MKKILLGSAAALAFGMVAGTAQAADPIKLTLGGYVQEWVGYATNQDSTANLIGAPPIKLQKVDAKTDAEIKFTGDTKLDNGLTVGVEIALNPSHTAAQQSGFGAPNPAAKRVFANVAGVFGKVVVGQLDNVTSLAHNSAPDAGSIYSSNGFWMAWVMPPANTNEVWQQTSFNQGLATDQIQYWTPMFAGFQAGVDYMMSVNGVNNGHFGMLNSSDADPAGTGGTANGQRNGDAVHGVLTYTNTFGDVTFKGNVGTLYQSFAGVHGFNAGTSLSFKNFTLGGSFINRQTSGGTTKVIGTGAAYTYGGGFNSALGQKGQSYDIGLSYTMGSLAFSGSYFHGSATNASAGTGLGKDTNDVYLLGVGYDMGGGVKLTGNLFQVDWKVADGLAGAAHAANQNRGWAFVSGLNVAF